jgi:hypothetical protein
MSENSVQFGHEPLSDALRARTELIRNELAADHPNYARFLARCDAGEATDAEVDTFFDAEGRIQELAMRQERLDEALHNMRITRRDVERAKLEGEAKGKEERDDLEEAGRVVDDTVTNVVIFAMERGMSFQDLKKRVLAVLEKVEAEVQRGDGGKDEEGI